MGTPKRGSPSFGKLPGMLALGCAVFIFFSIIPTEPQYTPPHRKITYQLLARLAGAVTEGLCGSEFWAEKGAARVGMLGPQATGSMIHKVCNFGDLNPKLF